MARAFDQIYSHIPTTRLLLIGYINVPIESMVSHPAAVIRTGQLEVSQLNQYLAACDICWLLGVSDLTQIAILSNISPEDARRTFHPHPNYPRQRLWHIPDAERWLKLKSVS